MFSPDGRWVDFIHEGGRLLDGGWATDIWRASPRYDHWENDRAERVVDKLPLVKRIAAFQDNRRLLVWHAQGLDIVDVQSKSRQPLHWPVLHDPDLPGGQPLAPEEPDVSFDGTQVVFSAWRRNTDPEAPFDKCLYICKLEGSGVRRLTPLEDVTIGPFKWLDTGRPAFEVKEDVQLYAPKP